MIDLEGKVALVSGGARGQGACEARLFAELGARVVIGDVLESEGETVAGEIGAAAVSCRLDVTSGEDWEGAIATAVDQIGRASCRERV